MSKRKVFYPVKDVTLRGILLNADVTLSGFLADAHTTLCGISDIWAYKEKISIRSGFVVAAHVLLMGAIKEIEVRGGVTLDAEDVSAVSTKDVKDLSAELMLDILMTAAMRKTISLQGAFQISGNAEYTKVTWLDSLCSAIQLGGEVKEAIMARATELAGGIQVIAEFGDLSKEVDARCSALLMALRPEIDLSLNKAVIPEVSGVSIEAVVQAVARRYREVSDLVGLTIADANDWNLRTFYYVEV